VQDEAWQVLVNLEAVNDALEQDFKDEQENHILNCLGEGGASLRPHSPRYPEDNGEEEGDEEHTAYFEVNLGEQEKKRAEAYAEHITRVVSTYQDVWGFREDYLGGRALEPEQAYALLESAGARHFSKKFFEAMGTPISGHTAEVVKHVLGHEGTEVDQRVAVRFDPPGAIKTAQYAPHWVDLPKGETVHSRVCSYEDPARTTVKSPYSWPLSYRDREGFKETVYPWPGSVLCDLRDAVREVSRFLGWAEEQVVWLILTGEAPFLNPLKVSVDYSRGKPATVKMEAAAWIPADVLVDNFRNIQQQVLTKGSDRLPVRSLQVCAFVERHVQDANEKSVWPGLWKKWNSENPDRTYGDFRGFRQTYFRNIRKVTQTYEQPKIKPSPKAAKGSKEIRESLIRTLESHVEEHRDRRPEG